MTPVTITRIATLLEREFGNLIDMSDWDGKPADQARQAFLSRSLAALCVKFHAGADPVAAAGSVTDGFGDNGLDAVFFDQKADVLILVQSKWSDGGNKALDAASASAFEAGVKDLLNAQFDRFNDKVKAKAPDVRTAILSQRPIRILLVTAHTAGQPTAPFVTRRIDDLVEELNGAVEVASAVHYSQSGVYGLITSASEPPKINLQVSLRDWGLIQKPFLAYYGRVHVTEVAKWWADHGNSLFRNNLRLLYANSEVNTALRRTLTGAPENFWYFNNGITLICATLAKSLVGGPERIVGVFNCENASVVNGAQTVGTVGGAMAAMPELQAGEAEADAPGAWVQVRIISLEKCPPELSRAITRAANLQNAVGNREFAGMDPLQHRLATEFTLDRRRYAYKQGEADPKGEEGCDIAEATQALACVHSIALTVLAKREIGALWANTDSPPYTELFNDELTSSRLWRLVMVMRTVDETLQTLKIADTPKADLIAVHLNRVILHLVYQDQTVRPLLTGYSSEDAAKVEATRATREWFGRVATYIAQMHAQEYLASLSKNATKCEAMVTHLLSPPLPSQTGTTGDQNTLF